GWMSKDPAKIGKLREATSKEIEDAIGGLDPQSGGLTRHLRDVLQLRDSAAARAAEGGSSFLRRAGDVAMGALTGGAKGALEKLGPVIDSVPAKTGLATWGVR